MIIEGLLWSQYNVSDVGFLGAYGSIMNKKCIYLVRAEGIGVSIKRNQI